MAVEKQFLLSLVFMVLMENIFCGVTIPNDKRLDGNVFFTVTNIKTSTLCGRICLLASRCEAFNYLSVNTTCSLVDQRINSTVMVDAGYVYSDINQWDTTMAGQCNAKPCDSNSFCVPKTTTHTCINALWGLSM